MAELAGLVAKAVGATSSEGCLALAARSNGQAIIFLPCGFFYLHLLLSFPRLISAVADWMSTILLHNVTVWP